MKKLLLLLILIPILAQAQKTTGANYTYIAQRYEWLAGVFKGLGLPAGSGPAVFQTGQEPRAGAIYYDSVGVDSGLYVWSGLSWNLLNTGLQDLQSVTDVGATTSNGITAPAFGDVSSKFQLAQIGGIGQLSLANTSDFSTVVKPQEATLGNMVFWPPGPGPDTLATLADVRNSTAGISEIIAGYGLLNVNDSTLDVDSLVIANRDWVMDRIAEIDTANLIVQTDGAGEPIFRASGDTLYLKSINGATTEPDGSLTIPTGTTYTFSTGLTEVATVVTNNLSTGVSGGQSIIGGTASGNSLTYSSTSHATKGSHIWGTTSKMWFDEANNKLYVGQATDLGTYGIQSSAQINVGRGQATSLSKFTFSNNTTGSAGVGLYTSTDVLQSLFRGSGPSIGTTLMGISKNNATELLGNSGPLFLYGSSQPVYISSNTTAPVITAIPAGRVGLNTITAPTAWLHLPAGTTAASTAPLKFTTGTSLTAAESGTVEYTTDDLFFTISTGTARKRFLFADPVGGLTSGRIPFVTTNGRLTDVSTVLWDGTTATFPLIKITGGSPGSGKVLTSDADGDATWTAAVKPTLTKNLNLESITASENKGIFYTPVAITVTEARAVSVGSSPSVTYNIAFGSDRTSGTNVYSAGQTTTSTTTGDVASGFNDATIPAGSYIWLTTSATSGTVTEILFTITYTED